MKTKIELQERTKIDGEVVYHIYVNGRIQDCCFKYEEAEKRYFKLLEYFKKPKNRKIKILKKDIIE